MVEEKRWRRTPPPDDALAVLIDHFIASGEPSPRHMAGVAAARRDGAGGKRGGG